MNINSTVLTFALLEQSAWTNVLLLRKKGIIEKLGNQGFGTVTWIGFKEK